jgi:hypothetical protein
MYNFSHHLENSRAENKPGRTVKAVTLGIMAKTSLYKLRWLDWVGIVMAIGLCLVAIWHNAIRDYEPIGYSGMYAQLAKQIADENFRLPMKIDFYGAGGVPAAFPPLGMYLLALYQKVGGPYWTYFRLIPPLFSTIALIPLFLIVRELTYSAVIAMISILFTTVSPYLYSTHTTSAGIVRGLAFVFGLFFFYFFIKATLDKSRNLSILAAVFLSLTALTHLSYAFFFVLWSIIWIMTHLKKCTFKRAMEIACISILLTLPWVLLILHRHGWQVFFNALGSHGTLSIFKVLQNPVVLFDTLSISTSEILAQPGIAILAFAGIFFSLRRGYWFLIWTFIFTSLFSLESRRFMVILGCIFAAIAIFEIAAGSMKLIRRENKNYLEIIIYTAAVLLIFTIYGYGFQSIINEKPSMSSALRETAKFLEIKSHPNDTYAILADHHEAEWFPFLAQRNPLFGFWGGEWDGNRQSLSDNFYTSLSCSEKADFDCLEKVFQDAGQVPDYMIVMKRRYPGFIDVLALQSGWKRVYKNSEYQIWARTY